MFKWPEMCSNNNLFKGSFYFDRWKNKAILKDFFLNKYNV